MPISSIFNRTERKKLSSDFSNNQIGQGMLTNEQALKILNSKHFSATIIGSKFYGLPASASRNEMTMKGRQLKRRDSFNSAELVRLYDIIKEELNKLEIKEIFFK